MDDEDYLFADPQPQWVPIGWDDYLKRGEVREDPDFMPSWNKDEMPEETPCSTCCYG